MDMFNLDNMALLWDTSMVGRITQFQLLLGPTPLNFGGPTKIMIE